MIPIFSGHNLPTHLIDSGTEKKLLVDVMGQIEDNTCIRFRARAQEEDYIFFNLTGLGCSTCVGRMPGINVIKLAGQSRYGTCLTFETVMHEVLHKLGLYHEQARADRDEFVTIVEENIEPGWSLI